MHEDDFLWWENPIENGKELERNAVQKHREIQLNKN